LCGFSDTSLWRDAGLAIPHRRSITVDAIHSVFLRAFFKGGQAFPFALTLRAFSMLLPQAVTLSMTNFSLR